MDALLIIGSIVLGVSALFLLLAGSSGRQKSWEEVFEDRSKEREEQRAEWRQEKEEADAQLRREQEAEVERRRATLAPLLSKTLEGLQTRPRDGELHAHRGHLHTSLAEWDKARDAYERALAFGLADEGKRAVVHLLYGRIRAREGLPMIMHDLTANYYGLTAGRYYPRLHPFCLAL